MRIIKDLGLRGSAIDRFESRGFAIAPVSARAHVSIAILGPGGRIGRHPASVDQCMVVISGRASVFGDNGVGAQIEAGQAALWEASEEHETVTDGGLVAMIVEAKGLAEGLA